MTGSLQINGSFRVNGSVDIESSGSNNEFYQFRIDADDMGMAFTQTGSEGLDEYTFDGDVYGVSFIQSSDIRLKTVFGYDITPSFESVANAPTIRYAWNDLSKSKNRDMHIGSVAQYWQTILPEAVTQDRQGYLAMNYDVIALLSAIAVAKRVTDHERRIEQLERENTLLRMDIKALKGES